MFYSHGNYFYECKKVRDSMITNNMTQETIILNSAAGDTEKVSCFILEEAGSTFDVAYGLLKEDNFSLWDSVLVGRQTKGRGQTGHNWHSPTGNLYATIRFPKEGFFNSHALSVILGGIVLEEIKTFFKKERYLCKMPVQPDFYLKWTNDLLITYQNTYYKVGGLLIEERNDALMLGIGINIEFSPKLNAEIDENALPAGNLSEYFEVDRTIIKPLWSRLVNSFYSCYKACSIQTELISRAESCLAFKNKRIRIINALPDKSFDYSNNEQVAEYTGILLGLSKEMDSIGGLRVDTDNYGIKTFVGGRIV